MVPSSDRSVLQLEKEPESALLQHTCQVRWLCTVKLQEPARREHLSEAKKLHISQFNLPFHFIPPNDVAAGVMHVRVYVKLITVGK